MICSGLPATEPLLSAALEPPYPAPLTNTAVTSFLLSSSVSSPGSSLLSFKKKKKNVLKPGYLTAVFPER